MNLEQLREELIADEGCKYTVYEDHLGLETLGIGHLITQQDPEFGQPVGTPVSEQRVHQAFNLDILVTVEDCRRLYPEWDTLPEEVQRIVANMMFNLGYPRLSKFVGMWKAVRSGEWQKAADEMVDSKWYYQVPNRAERLVQRMRSIPDEQDVTGI